MSVEIKELVIRAIVREDEATGSKSGDSSRTEVDRETIVRAVVAEVLRILKSSKER